MGREGPSFAKATEGKQEGTKRLVLIDGNAILHRAYHALPPLTTRSGELVNAVYGFATMLFRILDELRPEYIAVAFDTPGENFRHAEYLGYQSKRPETDKQLIGQIEKVHELVRVFNIPIFESPGYEADDTIGSLARQAAEVQSSKCKVQNLETIIVTGDKDLTQLVNPKVKLYMPTRGLSEAQMVGEKEVEEKMGVPPSLVIDYKGLVGDQSDNYPGVLGIGPKTATELLKKYGSLERIYEGVEGIVGGVGEKLKEGREGALLSKKLATIITNVPLELDLEKCRTTDYDKEKVLAFFKELGFRSLIRRVAGGEEGPPSPRLRRDIKDERQQELF